MPSVNIDLSTRFLDDDMSAQLPFHRSLASDPHNSSSGASWFEMISALAPSKAHNAHGCLNNAYLDGDRPSDWPN